MADDIQIQKMDGKSLDVTGVNKEKLKTVFPECFTEGNLDIDKLLSLCGEYIDNDFEKYKFEWKGKSECYRIAGLRSTGTLRPCPEESVDFENTNNLYIEGDNLEVLKLLQTAYYRKVKMIYIDPPYNTGNDFVYEDDFKDPMAKYKEITSQTTKSNPETMGRYHTNWLNMMYPRLRLAANLLRDDGVIFISIDEREVDNLKKICNEVFGEENYVQEIVWIKKFSPQNDAKYFSLNHESILCYAKNKSEFKRNLLPLTEEIKSRYKNPDNDPRGPWTSGDCTVGRITEKDYYPITTPSGREVYPSQGNVWRFSKETFKQLRDENRLWFGEKGDNMPRVKRFLSETNQGIVPISVWSYEEVGHTQSAAQDLKKLFDGKDFFDYPKPVNLIKKILLLSSENDDIILDFFSGSATTAHAVMQLNAEDGGKRQFIMVQLPELTDEKSEAFRAGYKNICEIGKERIRRAGSKIKEQNADVDVGFKVLKLDTSNLVKWDDTPISETEVLKERFDSVVKTLKFDRSELDVVYEVMLKLGIPVTYKVNLTDINGRKVYSIGEDGLILVCLDGSNGGITPEDISAMCDLTPAKIVAAEEAFKDDVALSNAYYISKDKGVEIELL